MERRKILSFENRDGPPERLDDEPALVVDVEGYEGPRLDLLLAAGAANRRSISPRFPSWRLADQYLVFIEAARKDPPRACRRLSRPWRHGSRFLKIGRLLLPEPATPDGPSAEGGCGDSGWPTGCAGLRPIREGIEPAVMNRPPICSATFFPRGDPGIDRRRSSHPKFYPQPCSTLLTAYAAAQRQQRVLANRASGKTHGMWVAERSESIAGAPLSGWPRTGAASTNSCLNYVVDPSQKGRPFLRPAFAGGAGKWSGRARVRVAPGKKAFAAALFSKSVPPQPVSDAMDRAGSAGRVSGRRRPCHGKPGRKKRGRLKPRSIPWIQKRGPEELRLLESAAVRLDRAARPGGACQADARRRRHQGCAGAAAGGITPSRGASNLVRVAK